MAILTFKYDTVTKRVKLVAAGAVAFKQEKPSGLVDGSNTLYVLSVDPQDAASVMVFIDGDIIEHGVGADQVQVSGKNITFGTAPAPGQKVYAMYAMA